MEEYRSNSNRSRKQDVGQPPKRAEKVTTGAVSQRRKGVAEKLLGSVIANDVGDIGEYTVYEVLMPALKRAFYDAVCNGLGMLLGERNPSRNGGPANRVSYRAYYDQRDDTRKNTNSGSRAKANYSYNDLVFHNRGDAEVVLERMRELLDHFDAVSIADLFDLAGEDCNYTDNKYGWTNLQDAWVKPVNGGYMIQLPRATTL